jgi:BirA family biotin operon repressor/biotin-[acetyl-CoA-carboxylase] ligase
MTVLDTPTPYSLIRRPEVASTQDLARDMFDGRPTLVVADRQTAGRGRSGAPWLNADRTVAMSLAFRPGWDRIHWPVIALVAGVAVLDAWEGDLSLKWPNDVIRDDCKVGGILVEAASGSPVVVGVGLNLFWNDPPDGVSGIDAVDPGAGAADRVADNWALTFLKWMSTDASEWPRARYTEACSTIGHAITWNPAGSGTATGIAADGALEVSTESGPTAIRSGQVEHVRVRND